jgi:hyperosmotically inducible protein
MNVMKKILALGGVILLITGTGCAPALLAGGAAGGYKVATDERPVGGLWDDTTITTKVNSALIQDPAVKARKIDVDTLQGVVMLTGVVATEKEAARAVEITQKVPGVKQVKNNLQIGKKSWTQALDDKVIGSKIKAKLINEPGIRSLNIDVDVNNGVVTLTGLVEYQHQKNRAIEIAGTTAGTVKVVDNLKVRD